MPSRAAYFAICCCCAVSVVSPTKLQAASSWKSTRRRPANAPRGYESQAVLAEGETLDIVGQRVFGGEAEIGRTRRNCSRDVNALALLDVDIDVGVVAQKRRQRFRQMFRQT